VDGVLGQECERARLLHGGTGVCLHAYVGIRATNAPYHKGQGDRVQVRLDLNKGRGRLVRTVIG